MTLKKLQNKKIALLGLGTENYWLLKYLLKNKTKAEITICSSGQIRSDERYQELKKVKSLKWLNYANRAGSLNNFEILFRSPGWPIFCPAISSALKINKKIILSSPMSLFLDLCPSKNIIGVTGSKGKGTTASLIYTILKTAGKKVFLGGNIGVAPFNFINQITASSWVVLELSSFQLEDLKQRIKIGVLTNLFKEHLSPADPSNPNYHKSYQAYKQAKLNLIAWQKKDDYFILNNTFKGTRLASIGQGKKIFFSKANLPTSLPGKHNLENIAAAETVAKILGLEEKIIAKAVKNFKGLEHRIEFVRELNGVKYYDDSFATTPESSIIALKSFQEPIVLLAGGADKGANFKNLARRIKTDCSFVCLLQGQATPRIKQELIKVNFKNYKIFNDFKTAIKTAKQQAKSGEVILLSTGCASFGMFTNYKERGRLFKEMVNKL